MAAQDEYNMGGQNAKTSKQSAAGRVGGCKSGGGLWRLRVNARISTHSAACEDTIEYKLRHSQTVQDDMSQSPKTTQNL